MLRSELKLMRDDILIWDNFSLMHRAQPPSGSPFDGNVGTACLDELAQKPLEVGDFAG